MDENLTNRQEQSPQTHGVITSDLLLSFLPEIEIREPDGIDEHEWRATLHNARKALEKTPLNIPYSKASPKVEIICKTAKKELQKTGVNVTSWDSPSCKYLRNEMGIKLALIMNLEGNRMFRKFLEFLVENNGSCALSTTCKNPDFNGLVQVIYKIRQKYGASAEDLRRGQEEIQDFLGKKIRELLNRDITVKFTGNVRDIKPNRKKDTDQHEGADLEVGPHVLERLWGAGKGFVAELSAELHGEHAYINRLTDEKTEKAAQLEALETDIQKLEEIVGVWRGQEEEILKKYENARQALAKVNQPDNQEEYKLPEDLQYKMEGELKRLRSTAPAELSQLNQKSTERRILQESSSRISLEIERAAKYISKLDAHIGTVLSMLDELGDHSYIISNFEAAKKRAGGSAYFKVEQADIVRFREAGAKAGRVKLGDIVRMEITSSEHNPFVKLQVKDGDPTDLFFVTRGEDDFVPWRLLSAELDENIPEREEMQDGFLKQIVAAGPKSFGDPVTYEMAYALASFADQPEKEWLTLQDIALIIHRDARKYQLQNRIGQFKMELERLGFELESRRSEDDDTVFEYRMKKK